jgi:hypothetical protein
MNKAKGGALWFKVGVNPLWPSVKLPVGDPRWQRHTGNFHTEEHTISSLCDRVAVQGMAFSAVMKDSYRRNANFISAQHLALDDDRETNESSLEALEQDPFIRDHAAFLYETPSSTRDKPRSRVVFVLEGAITDPTLYTLVERSLLWKFQGTDQGVKDCAPFFYGAVGKQSIILGRVLYADVVQEELVEPYLGHLGAGGLAPVRAAEAGDGPITAGGRHAHLVSIAGTRRRRGMGEEAIAAALLVENRERCSPPKSEMEVLNIARKVAKLYPPGGLGERSKLQAARERARAWMAEP